MKAKILLGLALIAPSVLLHSQVSINLDNSQPDPAAILDLKSTQHGFLPPRLTTLQIWQIANPPAGLMVFNTDSSRLSLYDGTNWRELLPGNCIPLPSAASAGADQFLSSNDTAVLSANSPAIGHGHWAVMAGTGGVFSDSTDPASLFWGPPVSSFNLRWTIATGCGSNFDDMNITFRNFDTIVYVSVVGNDTCAGTQLLPVRTIQHGIALAQATGKTRLNISAGIYNETVALASGVHLYGGYDSLTWTRNPLSFVTTLTGGSAAVTGTSVNSATLDGMTIIGSDAVGPGASAFGVFLNGCTGIRIEDCPVVAGDGTAGTNGIQGSNGGVGYTGQQGQPGCENSTFLCATCSQPQGGVGASSAWGSSGGHGGSAGHNTGLGNPGAVGGGPGGGSGGAGGMDDANATCTGYKIMGYYANGSDGANGANGANGAGGTAQLTFGPGGYIPSNGATGGSGVHGGGGGGGGGGMGGDDGCDSYGSGGGGGASGGQAGNPGGGGNGGGGSFAVLCYNSQVEVIGCHLTTGNGGSGGSGANGGTGGNGGPGAACGNHTSGQDDGGCGGYGGNGGKGGNGGIGGGGNGGPCVGIARDNLSTVMQTGNIFVLGTPGTGGTSAGNPGATGLQLNFN